jgi:hypothetical protein
MKQLRLCLCLLATLVMECSAQTSKQPWQVDGKASSTKITIESGQTTFKAGVDVTIMIRLKNLTDKYLDTPTTYWSAVVLFDRKEHKRLRKYMGDWSGPGIIVPGGEFSSRITLSEYGLTSENLSVGTHEVAMKIGDAVSNTLTIKITENR